MTRIVAAAALLVLLAGCTALPQSPPLPTSTQSIDGPGPVQPVGTPTELAKGLKAPWSVVPLQSGSTLISERDTAVVKELTVEGELRDVGTIPGVEPEGEGGLLGIAVLDGEWLYAYFTSASDNRIARFPLEGEAGSYSLGEAEVILDGIDKAGNHNGGRIKFGPDGMLYATVGDAGDPDRAQDVDSLNGKILRMSPIGEVPDDNPFGDSLVYSMGHRNPQGLTWDDNGQLWAAEFGQDTWDELNRIEAGENYGWPIVEGISDQGGFVSPVAEWATGDASPSGLVYTRGVFFLAALRGERLWVIYPTANGVDSVAYFTGEYGRIRDVVAGPDGDVWFITNNTDGRGDPREGDDRLWEVRLDVLQEG